MPSVTKADEEELARILTIEDFHTRTDLFRAYFAELSRKDPVEAARLLTGVEAKFRDYGAVELVAQALADVDIMAALDFADRIDSPRQADFIKMIALKEWGRSEPGAAAKYILDTTPSGNQARLFSSFASNWGRENPTEAMGFSAGIENMGARAAFLADVMEGWSSQSPVAASRAFGELKGEEIPRAALATTISRNWSEKNAAAAASWAGKLPENDPARRAALNQSMAKWSSIAPGEASAFLAELPRSETRDEAVAVFVAGAIEVDPDSATQWALSIDRHHIRRVAFQSAANYFAQRDPAEGQEWINSLGDLPDGWISDLLRRMNRDGATQAVNGP